MGEFSIDNIIMDLQLHTDATHLIPRATEDQIKGATSLVKRIDLKNFSVCQFANPGTSVLWKISWDMNVHYYI